MDITVNGQSRHFPGPLTVAELLDSLGINPKAVVVERNLTILDRKIFAMQVLDDGDHIEIIRLVGGG